MLVQTPITLIFGSMSGLEFIAAIKDSNRKQKIAFPQGSNWSQH